MNAQSADRALTIRGQQRHPVRIKIKAADGFALSAWLAQPRGEARGAVALAEGTDALPASPSTRFADGKLTGTKPAVPGGLKAELALVWAAGADGPVLVVAELASAERKPVSSFDNSRLYADLSFAGTPAAVLAEGAGALELAQEVLARMAVVTAHEQVGGAEALLHIARDYALMRKAFGQPIGAFQSIKHRIAELQLEHRGLDAMIEAIGQQTRFDELQLRRLKKRWKAKFVKYKFIWIPARLHRRLSNS